jgi:hypothetical protein
MISLLTQKTQSMVIFDNEVEILMPLGPVVNKDLATQLIAFIRFSKLKTVFFSTTIKPPNRCSHTTSIWGLSAADKLFDKLPSGLLLKIEYHLFQPLYF